MDKENKENLAAIYKLILSSPEMLVNSAALRQITIRRAYESVLEELEQLNNSTG